MDPNSATKQQQEQWLFRAAYLNEKGCSLMESGYQQEALETFAMALESLSAMEDSVLVERHHNHRAVFWLPSHRQRMHCGSVRSSSSVRHYHRNRHNNRQPKTTASSSCLILLEDDPRQIFGPTTSEEEATTEQQSPMFWYNQSFRFLPDYHDATGTACHHFLHLYKSILTFNSALSFHQRSMGPSLPPRLQETAQSVAWSLYRDATILLQSTDSSSTTSCDVARVLAATVNNAALLSYERQDYDQLECLQAQLHQLLVVHLQPQQITTSTLDLHCLQCFYFNATLLATPRTAAAA